MVWLALLSPLELAEDFFDGPLRDAAHLVVGAVLDGVFHEHPGRLEAKGFTLGLGRIHERTRSNEHAGNATDFQINDVVHTARRATASISEALDDEAALLSDLVTKIRGRRLGKGRLGITFNDQAALFQQFLETV